MTTLDPQDSYATLINTFVVKPEQADELVKILHEAATVMRRLDGFVSANLHVSTDRTKVVDYAQWRTLEPFRSMHANAEAQPHIRAAASLAESYDPVFHTLRYADIQSADSVRRTPGLVT